MKQLRVELHHGLVKENRLKKLEQKLVPEIERMHKAAQEGYESPDDFAYVPYDTTIIKKVLQVNDSSKRYKVLNFIKYVF